MALLLLLVGLNVEPARALSLPVVQTAEAAAARLGQAQTVGQGYLVDLARGSEGLAFQSTPATPLDPGRYRLHLLMGAGPAGNEIVDPIELRLTAGASQRHVKPHELPKDGKLAALHLDFVVTNRQAIVVSVRWFVGDSLLDVRPQEKAAARQKLIRRREAEIAKGRQSGAGGNLLDPSAAGAEMELELDKSEAAEPAALDSASPRYRLAIAEAHLETLCPAGIEAVRTDQPAYEPGAAVRLDVAVRNFAATEVQVTVTAGLVPADASPATPPGELRTALVTIPAGGIQTQAFTQAWAADKLGALTRIVVRATRGEARPAAGEALVASMPAKRALSNLPKKVFAHYMGCNPIGTASIYYHRQNDGQAVRHDAAVGTAAYFGGHLRNWDLVDPTRALSAEESADLEIRRALRIGIDGFAIDAWAGDKDARRVLDVLFKVAEEKDYPFELTICIDPVCGGNIVDSVKELLAAHGQSPKLARRDGRPLIFGYQSIWTGYNHLARVASERVDRLRAEPIGWHILGQSLTEAARQVGQPVYYHYCLSWFFLNVEPRLLPKDALTQAAGVLGRYADALGGFGYLGSQQPAIARAVRASGAEWSLPVGMFQKENIPFECAIPKGTDWMHWGQAALEQDATLIQIVTWNDYGENTCIAPAYNTRYTLYDLTGYEIALWKTGKAPAPDRDRVYLIYRKYPPQSKVFPFHAMFPGVEGGVIEVLTILPKPATVRLPGRAIDFEAPAGFHRRQFPVTSGPLVAELVRDGQVQLRLESPEPITDAPFREDNGLVCWSSEEARLWKEDFGATPPFWYSEYGDGDGDGLPNWFEMYWFSKDRGFTPKRADDDLLEEQPEVRYSRWLDLRTAGYAEPAADPDADGRTNLEEYEAQTDPTVGPAPQTPSDAGAPAR